MSKPLALNLDHVGVAMRDLDAGEQAFRRLGFRLTSRSFHRGSRTPGAPIEEWGSGNHCAMLERGYVEVIGLTDPSKFSPVKSMLDLYEGAHIVALEPVSVDAVHTVLTERGIPVDGIRDLERMAAYGRDGAEQRRVAFRNLYLTRTHFTEARLQYTEHLARDVMWQPHLLVHPNGATGLSHIFLCAPDAAAVAGKLAPALGVDPQAVCDGEYDLCLAASRIKVLTPAAWAGWAPGTGLPPVPAPVGVGIEVGSLEQTDAWLRQQGIESRHGRDAGIWVAPHHGCNTVLYFFDASGR